MISAKEAVQKAIEYFQELAAATSERAMAFRVEEIRSSTYSDDPHADDELVWHVTLSFVRETAKNTLSQALGSEPLREYKEFEVHARTGDVRAMKRAAA